MSIDASAVFPWESILEYLNSSTESIVSLVIDQTKEAINKDIEHICSLNIPDDIKSKIISKNSLSTPIEKELTESLYELYLYKMSSSIYLWLLDVREQIQSSTKKDLTDLFIQLKQLEIDTCAIWNARKALWIK